VRPKGLTDTVVMDYAPLNSTIMIDGKEKSMNTNNLREYLDNNIVEVVSDNDGNLYMQTTFEHEALIIVNAATDHDNPKASAVLTNTWAKDDRIHDWFLKRMFYIEGELTTPHLKALRALKKEYSNSSLRNLRTNKTNKKMDMKLLFKVLEAKHKMLNMDMGELGHYLNDLMSVKKTIKTQNGETEELVLGIKSIDIKKDKNNLQKITPEEQLILTPMQEWLNVQDSENPASAPLVYSKERNAIAHHESTEQIISILGKSKEITELQEQEGMKFAHKFVNKFYGDLAKMAKMDSEELEKHFKMKRPEYDDVLFELVVKASKELDGLVAQYGDGVHKIATAAIIGGLNFMQNIEFLPPANILDDGIHTAYKQLWEEAFFAKDVSGQYKSTKFELLDSYKQEGRFNLAKLLLRKKEKEC
jgi:hypothetical protein